MEFKPEDINSINNNEKQVDKDQLIYNLENKVSDLTEKLKQIDELKLDTEQKSKFEKIKDRIFNITRKTFNTVKWISIIGGTIGIANHERTHSDLEILTNPDGTHVYKHEDERTTHYLNILAGRDTFTEQDLRFEYDNVIKECYKSKIDNLEKKVEDMTIEELDSAFVKFSSEPDEFGNKPEDPVQLGEMVKGFKNTLNRLNDIRARSTDLKPNGDMYELVWQMEQECGNPRIRLVTEDIHHGILAKFNGLHYDALNNMLHIDLDDLSPKQSILAGEGFVSEMSHAKQFNDNQVSSYLNLISDIVHVLKVSKYKSDIHKEYKKLYHQPGTIEHEAHEIIEPYLERKYPLFVPKNSKEEK
ncbi:MAG: hypothetical protein KBB86_02530 [Candidatus Pacebacteria bacterium]|nr:hypothetical protein [Candidatus Paceibacterota bacterium]